MAHKHVRLLDDFAELADGWFWETDAEHRFIYLSARFSDVTGADPNNLLGRRRDEVSVQTEDNRIWEAHLSDLRAHRPFKGLTYRAERADGSKFWMRISGAPVFAPDGAFLGYRGAGIEITEEIDAKLAVEATSQRLREEVERLAQQDKKLRVAAQMFEQVEHIAGVGVWSLDLDDNVLSFSPQVRRIYEMDDGVEATLETAKSAYPAAARATVEAAIQRALEDREQYDIITEFVTLKGNRRWVRGIGRAEFEDGAARRLFGTFQDVTDERERRELIERLARRDSLTGLANRATFQTALDATLRSAAANQQRVAVAMIDLDDFKLVNDTIGHAAGDAVLRTIAERLIAIQPNDGLAARLGGDEFAIFAPEAAAASEAPDSILAGISKIFDTPTWHKDQKIEINGSIGIATFPKDGASIDDIIQNADLALYDAKARGKNKLSRFEKAMSDRARSTIRLRQDLAQALDELRLTPYYQPIVCLQRRSIMGFEALARWIHPKEGVVPAKAFFDLFNDNVVGPRISAHMVEHVIEDVRRWRRDGVDFGFVTVNLTEADLNAGNVVDVLLETIADGQFDDRQINVEITENTVLTRSGDLIRSQIDRLSAHGVGIALDDFGTGFASLSHLISLPVDIVKIDKSFVGDIPDGVANTAIVEAIATLGQKLGFQIVAEGVETERQIGPLIDCGCQFGQGFLFSRAVPREDAAALITQFRAPRHLCGA